MSKWKIAFWAVLALLLTPVITTIAWIVMVLMALSLTYQMYLFQKEANRVAAINQ